MTGLGVFEWPDGRRYCGDFFEGSSHGFGRFFMPSYKVQTIHSTFIIKGVNSMANGSTIAGSFVKGILPGSISSRIIATLLQLAVLVLSIHARYEYHDIKYDDVCSHLLTITYRCLRWLGCIYAKPGPSNGDPIRGTVSQRLLRLRAIDFT